MFRKNESQFEVDALSRSMAVIRFKPDGTILDANDNFLKTLGYALDEVRGRHHSMFVDPVDVASPEYGAFWDSLRRGSFSARQFRRIAKGGREVWIEASYNPVTDDKGHVLYVVKYATDITARKLQDADYAGKIAAISKSQAIIELALDGTILDVNDNYCSVMGYSRKELVGA